MRHADADIVVETQLGSQRSRTRAPCERSTIPIAVTKRSVFFLYPATTRRSCGFVWVAMVAGRSPSCVTGALAMELRLSCINLLILSKIISFLCVCVCQDEEK